MNHSIKIANCNNRAVLVDGDMIADIAEASGGRMTAEPATSFSAFAG